MAEEIMTSKESSFARFTMTERVPGILDDLLEGNAFSADVERELAALRDSVPSGKLTPLEPDYPFAPGINRTLAENPGYGWLSAPFLFAENYLYHRISRICGFFSNGVDYFRYKKEGEALKGRDKFTEDLKAIASVDSFSEISLLNLMGNKADLSQHASYYSSETPSELLIDNREKAAGKIKEGGRVDIVLDNAGEELFFDLLLAWWLLTRREVGKVKLHFKRMPYFVSDALISDYRFLLSILAEKEGNAPFVRDMIRFEEQGRLELGEDPFFVSGKRYSLMPRELSADFSRSDLIIFKGDLNYRRLVGDCYWPYETKTSSLVNCFKADILISRILKSEVMAGLDPKVIPSREKTDWMFSGRYGQIEFVKAP